MSKSFSFFAILALVVAVQLIHVEGVCTNVVANCADKEVHCKRVCQDFGRGAKLLEYNCDFYNLCTCTFEHPAPGVPPYDKCDKGMGLCSDECDNDCCNDRCRIKYPKSGIGYCIKNYGLNYCLCTYKRR
ncbi:hypothetical protein MtrunA17_Chr2g0298351 [Medicago truncatula]|uniref:Defensin-like protein n=1 Tax=Medicago truncatula TaxID=3880 RepID=A0A396J5M0_MEDTR|nr:hypothetical protein MtrunA17_Chr2g0298351 [Medicago truncatula]